MTGRLFIDKIEANGSGGTTTNLAKIRYNLSRVRHTLEEIIERSSTKSQVPTSVFHVGRFVAILQVDRSLTWAQMAFVDYRIVDLQSHFDYYADFLTPQTVQAFHQMQEKVKLKSEAELSLFVLSDDPLFFDKTLEN